MFWAKFAEQLVTHIVKEAKINQSKFRVKFSVNRKTYKACSLARQTEIGKDRK